MTRWQFLIGTLVVFGGGLVPTTAQTPAEVSLTVENNRYVPAELRVKAGAPFVIVITNKDKVAHEFEVPKLRIERLLRPGATVRLPMPALKAGAYEVIDDEADPPMKGLLVAE